MELPLDGGYQRARIPPTWQLQVYIDDKRGYLRQSVTSRTTAMELREAAAQHAGVPASSISLSLGGQEVDDSASMEELDLFARTADLTVAVQPAGDS